MNITQEELKRILEYNNGKLILKVNLNTRKRIGDSIGYKLNTGYFIARLYGKKYLIHRLVWIYHNGYFPEHFIDHKNRDRSDNRIENLREVTKWCNSKNCKIRSDNLTGITGVSYRVFDRVSIIPKYNVSIQNNNKQIFIGSFIDFSEAVAHRLAAEQCLGFNLCLESSAKIYMDTICKQT